MLGKKIDGLLGQASDPVFPDEWHNIGAGKLLDEIEEEIKCNPLVRFIIEDALLGPDYPNSKRRI